jgi:NAD(P)-dependent dehydrogenase (short-subunit alcohol dehydrogenase family)
VTRKTALFTGASRPAGLGFPVARQLAELDYHLVLTARDRSAAEPLTERLRHDGHAATALQLDPSDRPARRRECSRIVWAATLGADGPSGGPQQRATRRLSRWSLASALSNTLGLIYVQRHAKTVTAKGIIG